MQRPLWLNAASFAARKHQHSFRKDERTPYVAHVYRVAMTVRDVFGCDDPIAITAALLHDTIEDTGTDYDEIEEAFGGAVADVVAALSKNPALPEPEREVDYDKRLANAPWQARLVKLADCFDNYMDANSSTQIALDRIRARCVRAINLAKQDADSHPEVAWAIEVIEQLTDAD